MRTVLVVLVVLVSGCGRSMDQDASAIDAVASQVEALVVAHADSADAVAQATCTAEMTRYREALTQPLASFGQRCPCMDGRMRQMGQAGTGFGDLWQEMTNEADAHAATGCQVMDVAAELQRHREVMEGMCRHLREQATTYDGASMRMGGGCR